MNSPFDEFGPKKNAPKWPSVRNETAKKMVDSIYRVIGQMVAAKTKIFHSKNGPIEYLETPKRENQKTVVFLHGFADSKEGFFSALLHLHKYYHFIIPDLPGFGNSFKEEDLLYNLDTYTEWLTELLDSKGVQDYHIVGNSLGGAIAISMALWNNEKVKSLCAIDCAGIILEDQNCFYDDYFLGKNLFAIDTREQYEYLLTRIFHRKMLIPWPMKEKVYRQFRENKFWYAKLLHQMTDGIKSFDDPRIKTKALNEKISEINTKMAVIWGREDSLFPCETAEYIQKRVAGAKIWVMENTGHSPQIERPGAFSKVFRGFLGD